MMLVFALALPARAEGQQFKAVLELFTSQGCHSCPPADKLVGQYANQGDVLALSWHVDYWNYLGWQDTFSKPEFTRRQQYYAAAFKRRGVYTPQAVINGRTHVVGSNASEIATLIDTYEGAGKGLTVPVRMTRTGDTVRVSLSGNQDVGNATIWIVYFDRKKTVDIKRGENRGKKITYHNVVRDMTMLGMADRDVIDLTLPLDEMKRKGTEACAVIVQRKTPKGLPGAIIGAAVLKDLQSS